MLAIFVLMMVLSAGRPLGFNIPAGDDFVSWCMAAMAFLGLAHTFRSGEMIRVGLLIDRLPERARHWRRDRLRSSIGIGFIGFFAWLRRAADLRFLALQRHGAGRARRCRCGFRSSAMPAGLVILLIAFVDELVHVVRGNLPRYEKPKPQTAEEVVERAVQSGV